MAYPEFTYRIMKSNDDNLRRLLATVPDRETRRIAQWFVLLSIVSVFLIYFGLVITENMRHYDRKQCGNHVRPIANQADSKYEDIKNKIINYNQTIGYNSLVVLHRKLNLSRELYYFACDQKIVLTASFITQLIYFVTLTALLVATRNFLSLKLFRRHDFSPNPFSPIALKLGLIAIAIIHFGYFGLLPALLFIPGTGIFSSSRMPAVPLKLTKMRKRGRIAKIQSFLRTPELRKCSTPHELAKRIKEVSINDLEKVYSIHLWLAENISYDILGVMDGSHANSDPYKDFRNRRASCHGYSNIFSTLGEEVGLNIQVVYGEVRFSGYASWEPHNWIAVKIAGNWYYCDATWDAGTVDRSTLVFRRNEGRFNFFLSRDSGFAGTHKAREI